MREYPSRYETSRKRYRQVGNKTLIAKVFRSSRQTVTYWRKRANNKDRKSFKDKPQRPKQKFLHWLNGQIEEFRDGTTIIVFIAESMPHNYICKVRNFTLQKE